MKFDLLTRYLKLGQEVLQQIMGLLKLNFLCQLALASVKGVHQEN
jgi:hypothetical protein